MISEEEKKAIEYYQDKEVSFTLEKKNKDLCENYCPKYKELENKLETQTQNYHSAMEDVNYFCGNYIPKQKVRDKIEEWDKSIKWNNADDHYYAIKILKELLDKE